MRTHQIGTWVLTAFDSSKSDPRDSLKTEYDGFALHIKPGRGDACNIVAVFLENPRHADNARISINHFLSAMAWKDSAQYITLGSSARSAPWSERDKPVFNMGEGRVLRYRSVDSFDFEFLQNPTEQKQKLALALYREALNSNLLPLYQLLSFYKIINIGFRDPNDQMKWINDNLTNVRDTFGVARLQEMSRRIQDVGHHLYVQGRTAIAHAYNDPIKDPDVPTDVLSARQETELMHSLAILFIRKELRVPSLTDVINEHLYELAGFKKLFGDALVASLRAKEKVATSEFPSIPPLTIRLRRQTLDGLEYPCLKALTFLVRECEAGIVVLETDPSSQPIRFVLRLDFPRELLEFVVEQFNGRRELLTKQSEICAYRFLKDYFSNGYLRVFNDSTGERIAHKLAYIPMNLDLGRTTESFQRRIDVLEAELRGQQGV